MTKVCIDCKEDKPLDEFYKDKRRKDGRMSYCKRCQFVRSEASRQKRFPDKEDFNAYIRERHKNYTGTPAWVRTKAQKLGLPPTEIERTIAYYAEHEGKCDICGAIGEKSGRKSLFVDHCHESMTFRGLLCIHCNNMLGQAKDDTSVLRAGIAYLEKSL